MEQRASSNHVAVESCRQGFHPIIDHGPSPAVSRVTGTRGTARPAPGGTPTFSFPEQAKNAKRPRIHNPQICLGQTASCISVPSPTRFELYLTEENPQDFAQVDALRDINSFILATVSPPLESITDLLGRDCRSRPYWILNADRCNVLCPEGFQIPLQSLGLYM